MAHLNSWFMPPYANGELPATSNSIQYSAVLPDHMLQAGLESQPANWSSPAESMFSDFSCPMDGPTPPPSPPLPRSLFGYEVETRMSARSLKSEKPSPETSKRRVQKRPARLSHAAYSVSSQQDSEDKPSTPGSPESIDVKTEKTPAQKMRRLIQNRVSQRNFRQRQASRRQKLEEQVEDLQKRNKMYEDLLMKYEQMLRTSSDSNRVSSSGSSADFRDFGLY